ncbi:conserved hypothetical protein [Hyphomicrobiales bacterium]|nr:conserved hypothetical protein [Hyphomicrobiales bacterium]CAH1680458.1 conserved hypothetical protein [Hyphomicrobiales bacterium]
MASNPITNLYFFRRKSKAWSPQDLADLARLEAALRRCGLNIESEHGCSDEGDPWFIFTSVDTEDPIIHIAYIDGVFVIASGFGEALHDRALGTVVESFLTRHVSRLPVAQTPDEKSNVVAHPAALLPGLVAPLFVNNLSENLNNSYSTGVPIAATSKHAWVATAASRLKDQGSFPAAAVLLAALAAALHQRGFVDGSDVSSHAVEAAVVHDPSRPAMDVALADTSHAVSDVERSATGADVAPGGRARHVIPPHASSSGALEGIDTAESTGDKASMLATAGIGKLVSKILAAGETSLAMAADSLADAHASTDDISDAVKQAIDQMLAGGRGSNIAPDAEPRVQLASLAVVSDHFPEYSVADDRMSDSAGAEWTITAARPSAAPLDSDHSGASGRFPVVSPTLPEDTALLAPDRSAGSPSIENSAPPPSTLMPPSTQRPTTAADKPLSNDKIIQLVENFIDNNSSYHRRDGEGNTPFQGDGDITYTAVVSASDHTPTEDKSFVFATLTADDGTHIRLIGYLSNDVWFG